MIVGSKIREIQLGEGTFHCLKCEAQAPYVRKRFVKYFAVCSVPVAQTEQLEEFIVCSRCHTRFGIDAITQTPPSHADRILSFVYEELEGGTPLEMAYRRMIQSGVDEKLAQRVMSVAASSCTAKCTRCRFHYISGLNRCFRCGSTLQQAVRTA